MEKAEIIRIVLSASTSVCAMLLAVIGVLISMRLTVRLSGITGKGQTKYKPLIYLALGLLVTGTLSALFAFFYTLGCTYLYTPSLVLFVILMVGAAIGAIIIVKDLN